ncbi:MAG: DUF6748 domain-containing protein [Myxococcota bacterium]
MRNLGIGLLLLAMACSSNDGPSGERDSGAGTDTGVADTGPEIDAATDSGATDAGSDAAVADSGTDASDGGAEDAGEDAAVADAGTDAMLDAAPLASATYFVTRDFRRCPAPFCGGFWIEAVNLRSTPCSDSTSSADGCYVAGIDWSALGLSIDQVNELEGRGGNLLIEGTLESAAFPPAGDVLGELRADSAWVARWGTPMTRPTSESFYALNDTGVACLVPPCFSTEVIRLNVGTMETASGVDLSRVGAPSGDVDAGLRALTAGTLRASGRIADDAEPGPGGLGRTFTATQFYLPIGR